MKSNKLSIITWNLGYGGLGKESNFVMDGGKDLLAPSRQVVQKNLQGILKFIEGEHPDLFLFQEIARPSLVNRRVDVLGAVAKALYDYQFVYTPEFKITFVPPPLNIDVGLAIFITRGLGISSETRLLPLEPPRLGFFRQRFQYVINRIPIDGEGGEWVVVNTHLAVFDDKADIRNKQLSVLKEFAMTEFKKGNYVIMGGDWNMRLVETDFPHTTDEKYLFWIHGLPTGVFPGSWQIVADEKTPSVRTVHNAYVPNDNYVCVIDGFIVSPNVQVQTVITSDLNFEYSDHHPAKAVFFAGDWRG